MVLGCVAVCSLSVVSLAKAFSIDEVRGPYPTGTLVENQTVWDVTGLHTIRVYHVRADMTVVMRWYLAEDYLGRYEAFGRVPTYFEYGYSTTLPRQLKFAAPTLARHSDLRLVAHDDYIEVTTDTRYYWRYVKP